MAMDTGIRARLAAAMVAGVVAMVGGASGAHAQLCGDADGNGSVTVTDGVRVLRRAAALPQPCDPRACDVDGNGAVTITDGVNVLRAAADLPATRNCPNPEVNQFVDSVESGDGSDADLEIGVAPLPTREDDTVTGVSGEEAAVPGGASTVVVSYDSTSQGAATIAADGSERQLIIAVRRRDESFAMGFFLLPLSTPAGEVEVVLRFPIGLGLDDFFVAFATRVDGDVGRYRLLRKRRVSGPTPTPTRTPRPTPTAVCGNGVVEPPEKCDPAVSARCPGTVPLQCVACQCVPRPSPTATPFCGDGIRNGSEACDGNDLSGCRAGALGCSSTCTCFDVPR